jgi:hypothetical protein
VRPVTPVNYQNNNKKKVGIVGNKLIQEINVLMPRAYLHDINPSAEKLDCWRVSKKHAIKVYYLLLSSIDLTTTCRT